ncbi:hypothetical protein GCM10011321_28930 [Youhaiella tibetensis]|uniref:FMN-binding protein n=1 Tax=Paradevosia tibetensis TaxID=1447062 RepID=A0A5B9DJ57_9HYPH|nr:FMN-binding protein [Youhaiella tibetensis]QEE19117.1 FMN-binding protein [Youhaiella tibetensis]GGF36122.1 hypothetical protein GCM10011321_28930 [Youhaiella tibetensis]
MRKALLSLAVLAGSGIYVAQQFSAIQVPTALDAIAPPAGQMLPASGPVVTEPAAPAPQTAMVSQPPAVTPSVRQLGRGEIDIASTPTPSATITPPLPQPRPLDAPVSIVQAAATTINGQYRDGTYQGPVTDAYYGNMQVQATIQNGQLTGVDVLQYPNDRRTSRYINSQALPMLEQEVISAHSANVNLITGATLTSQAYVRSLQGALDQARN